MSSTTKVMRKLCAQIQSGGSYEAGAMFAQPFTAETITQKYDPIEDDSITGEGFAAVPQQGPRHTEGAITQNLEVIGCETILEAAFGANSSGVFTLGSNVKKLSMCGLNAANAIEYANVYVKRLRISGSSGGNMVMDYDVVGVTAQDRDVIGSYPSVTDANDPITFHEAGGTGYFRIGDATDALDSDDEENIEDFNIEITTGFDSQYCNEGVSTLTPEFGMVPPTVSGSVKISRHDADTFQDFEDADTALQAELYLYKSATENIKIQIPRFKITCDVTDEDVARQEITMFVGRNGSGSNYKNSSMAFVSPVRVTVVNS